MALSLRAKRLLLAAAILFFFMAVLVVWAPRIWINRPQAKAAIQRHLSTAVGATITYDQVKLSIFPRICASIEHPRLDLPNQVAARAAEIDLCLQFLPLLRGRVMPASAQIRFPEIELTASDVPAPGARFAPADILKLLAEVAGRLRRLPESDIEVNDGRLKISGPRKTSLDIAGVNLRWRRSGPKVQWAFESRSDMFASLSSAGRLDTDTLTATATLKAADVQAHRVYACLRPGDPLLVRDARLDLDLAVRMDGPAQLNAVIQARAPEITLGRPRHETRLSVDRLIAEVNLAPQRLAVDVQELVTAAPRAAIELSIVVDELAQPRIDINLGGRGDAGEVRQAVLALLEESGDINQVFEILRDGEVPAIEILMRGNTWNELMALSNLRIDGRLEKGRVYLPWIDLDLDAVYGDVRIAEGILEGRGLKAFYKGTRGANGSLRVGLSPADPVLQLDIYADADLSPLPAVLDRVVADPAFRREAARIEEFSGTARGTLQLDGTHRDVSVTVLASDLDVKARHPFIPYPLRFQGGEFIYAGNSITLHAVDVAVGNSRLTQHDLTLGLAGGLPVEARSPRAVIDLAETFNVFRDRPPFSRLHRLAGIVALDRWHFAGDLRNPATWKLASSGTVQHLAAESELLPGILSLPSGSFDWNGQALRYAGARGSIHQTELRGVEVEADWAAAGLARLRVNELDVSIADIGHVLQSSPQAVRHAGALYPMNGTARLRDVRLQTRLLPDGLVLDRFTAGLIDARINSKPIGLPLALSAGTIEWQRPMVNLQIEKASLGQSEVQHLSIAAGGGLDGGLDLYADGAVIECGEIFPRLPALAGLKGLREDVRGLQGTLNASRVRIKGPLQDPRRWNVQAVSEFKQIVVTTTFLDDPIQLPAGRLTFAAAEGPKAGSAILHLDSVRVRMGADAAVLSGQVALATPDTTLDLDILAEAIDWSRIAKLSDRFARHRQPGSRPVRGRLVLRLDRLVIDRVHLYPFIANVQLAADATRIEIERAGFCGMPFIGRVAFEGPMVDAYLAPVVDVMQLDGVISCLSEEKSLFSGNFNLDGQLSFRARRDDLIRALKGRLAFVAEDGTIRQSLLFARLFALLNLTEIYRGKLPDFNSRGLDYKRSTAVIEIGEGKIRVEDWSIDGRTLWLGSRGEIDIATQQIDFTIMVSPFKTIDRIINSIPGLRWILGGRLVAIPMRAVGSLEDPQVVPLSPAAVGTSIVEMIERTLLLPIQVIQPLVPGMPAAPSGTISR